MLEFDLPLLRGDSTVESAFEPMIHENKAGIVVATGDDHRLLHFTQVQAAWKAGITRLEDVAGYVPLSVEAMDHDPAADYDFVRITRRGLASPELMVRSRHEGFSLIYTTDSPGYTCDGPKRHTYPPQKRGRTNKCVVLGCPGTV